MLRLVAGQADQSRIRAHDRLASHNAEKHHEYAGDDTDKLAQQTKTIYGLRRLVPVLITKYDSIALVRKLGSDW